MSLRGEAEAISVSDFEFVKDLELRISKMGWLLGEREMRTCRKRRGGLKPPPVGLMSKLCSYSLLRNTNTIAPIRIIATTTMTIMPGVPSGPGKYLEFACFITVNCPSFPSRNTW
jgi:hypothetical protein